MDVAFVVYHDFLMSVKFLSMVGCGNMRQDILVNIPRS